MARIRNIKPDFGKSRRMARLSRPARLLFVQLWLIADDEGRARAAPAGIAAFLYPVDTDAPALVPGWLDELEREECIERYSVDSIGYLRVVDWHKLQYIRHPTPSRLPPSPNERPRVA
jgi:hypothetical protein